MNSNLSPVVSRFAPSPTGRMHLGNIFTALMSWLAARSSGGKWILRIEDLDPQRSRPQYARQIEDDLLWLGLHWDEGGVDGSGPHAPYCQSGRHHLYEAALEALTAAGSTYPCFCTKADINASQAPHASDGRVIYPGTCRPAPGKAITGSGRIPAVRLKVEGSVEFDDAVFGHRIVDLGAEWGDFVLRRADGAWAYQLAVVVDDAQMGVTHVVRGSDLLGSCAPQLYLCRLLGFPEPHYIHLPLICNSSGIRLSKRDQALGMEHLRQRLTPRQIIGLLARLGGLVADRTECAASELVELFDVNKIPRDYTIRLNML